MELSQYDIVLVDLNPTIGSEMNKTRPCVIVSPNDMNLYLNTIIIAPLTSSLKPYPSRIEVTVNDKVGNIALDQIKTIDKKRIIKKFKTLNAKEIARVKAIIKEMFVD
jgi:mRNA interferase MazF